MTNFLTQEQVHDFLDARKKASTYVAIGVLLCILSAAPLLVLISFTHLHLFRLPIEMAISIGVIILLILIAIAVAFLIVADHYTKVHESLEYENCELPKELAMQIENAKNNYAKKHMVMTITATILCIASAIPILCGAFFTELLSGNQIDSLMTGLVAITLILVAIGVFFFVKSNTIRDSYDILLQIRDYSPQNKKGRKTMHKYATIYWLIAILLYLSYSFITKKWDSSWIIWPLAGITYGILEKLFSMRTKDIASD